VNSEGEARGSFSGVPDHSPQRRITYQTLRKVQSDGERAEADQKAVGVHPGGNGGCYGDQSVILRGVGAGETTD
jgi:hypothetical protein